VQKIRSDAMSTRWTPDPTFYPSARLAAEAPREQFAYLAGLNPDPGDGRPDALGVVDLDPESDTYATVVHWTPMPGAGDELHHFGWNACSAALCPTGGHPHTERRYLIVPGLKSSRIHILDTKPDPRRPEIVKVIEPEELLAKTGYSRPHTSHCGPDGRIYLSALGNGTDGGGPGGIFLMDCDTFELQGAWERDRGDQFYAYDFWWHLGHDRLISSEWAVPSMYENGVVPEKLLANEYGHRLHVWDLRKGRNIQTIDLGAEHQMVLELRPAKDPSKAYGFAGVVVSTADLSASVFLWRRRDDGQFEAKKVISIPAQPAETDQLPPALQPFGAVPPLITDINLSLDDRWLYISCWGTGELHRYDVSDPDNPRLTAAAQLGGVVRGAGHPRSAGPVNGGPQMVEVSRDGRRVYVTNSLYSSWDDQFYPAGLKGWMAKLDAGEDGGLAVDPEFWVEDFGGLRPHQVRLQGGDASSDSYCFA
jgi:selenium-binding protein 1